METLPLFLQDINLSFDHPGDEMPANRLKILHPTGTVAKFKFVSYGNHPFTGVLRGADYGILRISEVADVNPEAGMSSPSMGLKFLRDGIDSANCFSLHAFEG